MPERAVRVPRSFLEMPRWRREGAAWLAALPELIRARCASWRLRVTGEPVHGSNAVVIPVTHGDAPFVLRLTMPGPDVADQIAALTFWAGRGTVRLIRADAGAGVMLLERLGTPLATLPVEEAMPLLGRMMRRLAVPAPPDVPCTAAVVRDRTNILDAEWHGLGRPFDVAFLRAALAAGSRLSHTDSALAVNGDMHSGQVLRGEREPWLTVDPVLMRGDIGFDLARVLWTRLDEMPTAAAIRGLLVAVVRAAGIDSGQGRDWVLWRSVDYWLWGLSAGLTEDPLRCRRLMTVFTA